MAVVEYELISPVVKIKIVNIRFTCHQPLIEKGKQKQTNIQTKKA